MITCVGSERGDEEAAEQPPAGEEKINRREWLGFRPRTVERKRERKTSCCLKIKTSTREFTVSSLADNIPRGTILTAQRKTKQI